MSKNDKSKKNNKSRKKDKSNKNRKNNKKKNKSKKIDKRKKTSPATDIQPSCSEVSPGAEALSTQNNRETGKGRDQGPFGGLFWHVLSPFRQCRV